MFARPRSKSSGFLTLRFVFLPFGLTKRLALRLYLSPWPLPFPAPAGASANAEEQGDGPEAKGKVEGEAKGKVEGKAYHPISPSGTQGS